MANVQWVFEMETGEKQRANSSEYSMPKIAVSKRILFIIISYSDFMKAPIKVKA